MPRISKQALARRNNGAKNRDYHERSTGLRTNTKVQEREIQLVHSKLRSGTTTPTTNFLPPPPSNITIRRSKRQKL